MLSPGRKPEPTLVLAGLADRSSPTPSAPAPKEQLSDYRNSTPAQQPQSHIKDEYHNESEHPSTLQCDGR
eukprot:1932839-Rhodomonas_salina.1